MWKLCCPELLPHLATVIFGHLVPTLKLLPTSHQGGIGCPGGSWAVISPWKQQEGTRHSRAGFAFRSALSHPVPCSFPRWVSPACPALGPLYWGVVGRGIELLPGKWPHHNSSNRLLNPGLELLIPSHTDCCSAAPGNLCVNVSQAEDFAWLQCKCQNYQRNMIFKYFLTIQS